MSQPKERRPELSPELQTLRPELGKLRKSLKESLGSSYVSVYAQRKLSRSFAVNLKVSRVNEDFTSGVVLRAFDGFTLFEVATDNLEIKNLQSAAETLVKKVRSNSPAQGLKALQYTGTSWSERLKAPLETEIKSQIPDHPSPETPVHFGIRVKKDPHSLKTEDWIALGKNNLERLKSKAAALSIPESDLHFLQAQSLFGIEESVFIDNEVNLSQTLFRMEAVIVAVSGPDKTHTMAGGLGGLECLEIKDSMIETMLTDLKALKSAERLKPGKYRVLFSPGLSGVLAHEAFGHSQEGDTCARGRSKAWDLFKNGELVGNEEATILNNPAIFENGAEGYAAWGSYFFDEEGWLGQEQILLNKGRLESPMTNLTSALRLGVPRTANGKRESWSHGVYTRQTNTYFSAGNKSLNELMSMISDGFLAANCGGGMEDPKGMNIQVGMSFLKEVKNGQLTGRVFKGPAGGDIQMTGFTPDVLRSIVAKSKIEYDREESDRFRHPFNEVGGCGKYHKESVQAGCGGTYLLMDQIILG